MRGSCSLSTMMRANRALQAADRRFCREPEARRHSALDADELSVAPLTGISRNAHLLMKTPGGRGGILASDGPMSRARCTDMCGLEERSV